MSVEIRFEPGLVPVLKHGSHNQKDHAGKSGSREAQTGEMKIKPGEPSKGEEQHIEYNGMYVPTAIPVLDNSSVDNARIASYSSDLEAAGTSFAYWDGNYATRVVSARIMGLEGGFNPRGGDSATGGDGKKVVDFLNGRGSADDLDGFDASIAQTRVRDAVMLLDATSNGAAQPQLWRGIRLKEGDPRLSAQVGDEFEMPVSAFSTRRDFAEMFASTTTVGGARPSDENSSPVLIDVKSGARGHATGPVSAGGEVLSQGRFRVVELPNPEVTGTFGTEVSRMTLQQVAHYDVLKGEWVSDE